MAQATNVNYFGLNSLEHLWGKIKAQDSSLYDKLVLADEALDSSLASYAHAQDVAYDSSMKSYVDEQDSSLWAKVPVKGVKVDGSLLTPDADQYVNIDTAGTYVKRADFDSSLTAVDGSIGDLKAKDTQIDASLADLVAKDTQIDSSITALKAKDENIDSSIVALKAKDTQIDASLAELIAKDGQIDSSIVRLDGRIDALGAALKYKGTKQTYEELPTEGNEDGDVWNVVQAHGDYPAGTNYAWDGSDWDPLGGAIDTSAWLTNENMIEISDASIDAVCV